MPKITLSLNDILYICASTAQNTINLFPIHWCRNWNETEEGQTYCCLLTTPTATKYKWTSRLENILPNVTILEIDENGKLEGNIKQIQAQLFIKFNLVNKPTIIINYGGGTKLISFVLWELRKIFEGKIIMTYPDKGQDRMSWIEFTDNNITQEIKNDFETDKDLRIGHSFEEVMSLFRDTVLECNYLIKDQAITPEGQRMLALPDLYHYEELKDLLYESAGSNAGPNLDELTVNEFFANLNPNTKDKDKYILDPKFKSNAIENIATKINSISGYEFKVDTKSFTLAPKSSPIKFIDRIPCQILRWIWQKGMYVRKKEVTISKNALTQLKALNLNLPLLNLTGQYTMSLNFVQQLFENTANSDINNHGKYLEHYCIKFILSKFKNNLHLFRDVLINFVEYNNGQKLIEIDIVLYTEKGNIYFFECKTYDFGTKDFLAANYKVSEMGGVFNKYYIVIPPLPNDPKLKADAIKHFKRMYDNISFQKSVVFCQINSKEGLINGFEDFESVLDKIMQKESKSVETPSTPSSP